MEYQRVKLTDVQYLQLDNHMFANTIYKKCVTNIEDIGNPHLEPYE